MNEIEELRAYKERAEFRTEKLMSVIDSLFFKPSNKYMTKQRAEEILKEWAINSKVESTSPDWNYEDSNIQKISRGLLEAYGCKDKYDSACMVVRSKNQKINELKKKVERLETKVAQKDIEINDLKLRLEQKGKKDES